MQAYVSRARVESFSLIADMMYVSSNAPRIARSVFEICLRRGWSSCAELALTLCKVSIVNLLVIDICNYALHMMSRTMVVCLQLEFLCRGSVQSLHAHSCILFDHISMLQ